MNSNETIATTTYPIGQHPSMPPPATERGIFKWLKINLFNTWYNSIATILGLYFLYLVIPPTFDWVWGSATWEASSNKDCRAGAGAGHKPLAGTCRDADRCTYPGTRPDSLKKVCEVTSTSGLATWASSTAMSFSRSSLATKPWSTILSRTLVMNWCSIGRRS